MASYPSSLITYTNPVGTNLVTSPDHAANHTSLNNEVIAIETTVGTNSGTNILKNFVAGDFPARINSGGTFQQAIVGTLNNSTFGTPAITGGSANSINLGTPTITLGSDAQGDIFYRSSAGTIARLAPGTSGQFLKTQGAAANPTWGTVSTGLSSQIITSTRDMAGTTGSVSYTGVGFKPTAIQCFIGINGSSKMSWGFSDSAITSGGKNVERDQDGSFYHNNGICLVSVTGTDYQSASITSYEADGFILSWVKTGSPTGTATLVFICFK